MSGPDGSESGRARRGRPQYSHTVSLGNVLSIVAMVVTVALVFSDLKVDVRVLHERVHAFVGRLVKVENRVGLGEHPGDLHLPRVRRPQ